MCNLKDFIENKVDFLRKDCLNELLGEPLGSSIEFMGIYKAPPKYGAEKKLNDNIVCYFDLDKKLLFTVNKSKKQIIFNIIKHNNKLKMDGYELFYFDKIKEEYDSFIEKFLVKFIDSNDCKKLYVEKNSVFKDTFDKSPKDYYNHVMYEFIYNNITRNNLMFDVYCVGLIKRREKTSRNSLLLNTRHFDLKMLDWVSIYNLSDEEKYNYILNNDNYILDELKEWDVKDYIKRRFKENLIDKAKEELGNLNKDDKAKEYLKIANALNSAGKTVYINDEKVENILSCYNDIKVDSIKIDDIETIKFRNKVLYQK